MVGAAVFFAILEDAGHDGRCVAYVAGGERRIAIVNIRCILWFDVSVSSRSLRSLQREVQRKSSPTSASRIPVFAGTAAVVGLLAGEPAAERLAAAEVAVRPGLAPLGLLAEVSPMVVPVKKSKILATQSSNVGLGCMSPA
jgi:hypothetical protein